MIDEEAWTEIGSNADWWGRPKKQMTCRARANAKESRIDGFLVNKEAFPLVHDFYVEQDEMIPTHACVGIVLSRNASTEPRRFARTLPCLKHFSNKSYKTSSQQPAALLNKSLVKASRERSKRRRAT